MTKSRLIRPDSEEAQKAVQKAREGDFGGGTSVELYTPDPKKKNNHFFIFPYWTDSGPDAFLFFKKTKIHWRIPPGMDPANQMISIRCSQDFGRDHKCYSCSRIFNLRESSDAADKALAKEASAKTSVWVQGLDIENPKDEDGNFRLKLWRAGYVAFTNMMALYDSKPHFTDLEGRGCPVNIKITQQAKRVDTAVVPLDTTPISKFGLTVEEALNLMYDLSKLEALLGYMREIPWDEQKLIWTYGKDWKQIQNTEEEGEEEESSPPPKKAVVVEQAEEEDGIPWVEDDEEAPAPEPTQKSSLASRLKKASKNG